MNTSYVDVSDGLRLIRTRLVLLNMALRYTYKVKHNGFKYVLYKQHHSSGRVSRSYSTELAKSSNYKSIIMIVDVFRRNQDF